MTPSRRSFLAALCALPFLRWVRVPKTVDPAVLWWPRRYGMSCPPMTFSYAYAFLRDPEGAYSTGTVSWLNTAYRDAPPPGQGT